MKYYMHEPTVQYNLLIAMYTVIMGPYDKVSSEFYKDLL